MLLKPKNRRDQSGLILHSLSPQAKLSSSTNITDVERLSQKGRAAGILSEVKIDPIPASKPATPSLREKARRMHQGKYSCGLDHELQSHRKE